MKKAYLSLPFVIGSILPTHLPPRKRNESVLGKEKDHPIQFNPIT